jgi:hypothetical protein
MFIFLLQPVKLRIKADHKNSFLEFKITNWRLCKILGLRLPILNYGKSIPVDIMYRYKQFNCIFKDLSLVVATLYELTHEGNKLLHILSRTSNSHTPWVRVLLQKQIVLS